MRLFGACRLFPYVRSRWHGDICGIAFCLFGHMPHIAAFPFKTRHAGVAVHRLAHILGAGLIARPQVEIMHEAVLLAVAQVDEGGVEPLHDLLHPAEEDITHRELVAELLGMEFNQLLVLGQRNTHTRIIG